MGKRIKQRADVLRAAMHSYNRRDVALASGRIGNVEGFNFYGRVAAGMKSNNLTDPLCYCNVLEFRANSSWQGECVIGGNKLPFYTPASNRRLTKMMAHSAEVPHLKVRYCVVIVERYVAAYQGWQQPILFWTRRLTGNDMELAVATLRMMFDTRPCVIRCGSMGVQDGKA